MAHWTGVADHVYGDWTNNEHENIYEYKINYEKKKIIPTTTVEHSLQRSVIT